jgi:hypothetical protein
MNSTPPAVEPVDTAVFGVSVSSDGAIKTIRAGSFDAGEADEIARQLVLLASAIRSAARRRLFESEH